VNNFQELSFPDFEFLHSIKESQHFPGFEKVKRSRRSGRTAAAVLQCCSSIDY
jgi:hypothetical protein